MGTGIGENMKRRFIPLVTISLLFTACSLLGPSTGSTPAVTIPEVTPTRDLGQPDGVAQAFLDAWMNNDYEGMYSLLSPNSQAEYTLQDFTNIYTSAATTMTLASLEIVPLSSLSESTGTTAQFAFRVTYNTQVLGPIQQDLTMQLVFADGRWGIAWTPGLIFPQLAGGNILQLEIETPSRANIYDRNGLWLVSGNASTVTVSVVPGEVSPEYEEQMLDLLSSVLRMTPDEIRQQYAGAPADWVVALGDADAETVQANWPALSSYPPLRFSEKSGRRYFNLLAPHVLGYTGYIPADQLDAYRSLGYQGDEIVGLSGLEKWGESYLAGVRGGSLNAYTPSGQFFAEIARRDPQPAQSLYTTLDRNLQAIVQDTIEEAYQAGEATWAPTAGGAAVVVLDVNTGDVLAMASYPYFDPNALYPFNNHPFAMGGNYLQDLLNNPLKPFLNRATQGQYPPGSIFKIVTMAAALGSGLFQPDTPYTCTGVWTELGPQNVRYDWKEGGHGELTLAQALTASCNPYFYHIGLVTGQSDFNLIPSYARMFGFGQELGIQIDEEPGLIPDPDWLLAERGQEWNVAYSVNIAIGQGDVLVTPLQVATMIAAIANNGTVYQPQFVDRIGLIGEEPTVVFEPHVLGTLSLSREALQTIRESMRGVASDIGLGTAEYRLGSMQIPVAGKTGTAQVSQPNAAPIAWFGGFVPYDDPELAIVVMIENGGQGSSVAAPIFRRIVERYYGLRELPWPPDWSDPTIFDFVTEETIGE